MADMTPLNDILNGTAADATDVQANFQTIETYINGTNLIRADGTEVMAANLDLDGNTLANISGLDMNATQITDLADGTADTDAVNKGQMDTAIGTGGALPLGVMGHAIITSDQNGITGSVVDVTSATVTWTAVSSRLYRTSFFTFVTISLGSDVDWAVEFDITDASNNVKGVAWSPVSTGSSRHLTGSIIETGLSGSVTRKLRAYQTNASDGSFSINTSSGLSATYILVEDIGLA